MTIQPILVVVNISATFTFKVSAVGCYCNRGVGKTHCSVVHLAPQSVFALFSQSSPQTLHHDTQLHFLLPPTRALSPLCLFLANHIVWAVIIAENSVTDSPHKVSTLDTYGPSVTHCHSEGPWNKTPAGTSDYFYLKKDNFPYKFALVA